MQALITEKWESNSKWAAFKRSWKGNEKKLLDSECKKDVKGGKAT